jgi:hypothetical protein
VFSQDGTVARDRERGFALDQATECARQQRKCATRLGSPPCLISRNVVLLWNLYAEDI